MNSDKHFPNKLNQHKTYTEMFEIIFCNKNYGNGIFNM